MKIRSCPRLAKTSLSVVLGLADDFEYLAVRTTGFGDLLRAQPSKPMVSRADRDAVLYCIEDAARQHMRAYKVLYGDFDNDPTVPVGDNPTATGVIFIDPEHRFYVNVWTHDMLGPYETWQAAAACAKLILDSEGDK